MLREPSTQMRGSEELDAILTRCHYCTDEPML